MLHADYILILSSPTRLMLYSQKTGNSGAQRSNLGKFKLTCDKEPSATFAPHPYATDQSVPFLFQKATTSIQTSLCKALHLPYTQHAQWGDASSHASEWQGGWVSGSHPAAKEGEGINHSSTQSS